MHHANSTKKKDKRDEGTKGLRDEGTVLWFKAFQSFQKDQQST